MSQQHEDHFVTRVIRPRFEIETEHSVQEVSTKIKEGLKREDAPCKGRIKHGHGAFYLPMEEQHYWSPQLSFTLEELGEGSLLRGVYGPRPGVWTMFVFFYAAIGFITMIILIVGLSYWTLDKPAYILWLVPFLLLIFLSLYLVSHFGQKMGRDQMIILHHFMEDCTGLDI